MKLRQQIKDVVNVAAMVAALCLPFLIAIAGSVRAHDPCNDLVPAQIFDTTVLGCIPTNLVAPILVGEIDPGDADNVNLTWNPTNADSHTLRYWFNGGVSPVILPPVPGDATAYTYIDLAEGDYRFMVEAVDALGNSLFSNNVELTIAIEPPPPPPPPPPPVASVAYHVFGHSAYTYHGGDFAEVTYWTETGEWLGRIAQLSGTESAGTFTFTNMLWAPLLNWSDIGGILVNGWYEESTNPHPCLTEWPCPEGLDAFAYTHFLTMPSNFMLEDAGFPPDFDEPIDQAVDAYVIQHNNVANWFPNATQALFVYGPEADPHYLSYGANDPAGFSAFNQATMGPFLDRHVRIADEMIARGHDVVVYPVLPIVAHLFETEPYLAGVQFQDVYGDGAPHGSENIHLMQALVMYRLMFGQAPDLSSFAVPGNATQIIPAVADNLVAIDAAIAARIAYYRAVGVIND